MFPYGIGWNCVIGGNLGAQKGWTNSMECFDADLPYTGQAQRTTIPLSVRRRLQSPLSTIIATQTGWMWSRCC